MSRSRQVSRCTRCRMSEDGCICALFQPVPVSTRIILVAHHRELIRTTNTGQIALEMVPDSHLVVRGDRARPEDYSPAQDPSRQAYLLFPSDEAEVLSADAIAADGRPVTFVVPDGNWRQASKVATRVAELRDLPRRILPPGPPTEYLVRRETRPGGLATYEAIVRALALVHGPEVMAPLLTPFHALVNGTLKLRGVRRADVVARQRLRTELAENGS